MDGSGYLEASGVTIRGTIFATAGLFNGTVQVGGTPAISGTTMTGSGALFNAAGSFAFGTSARNAVFNGTDAPRLNGDWVGTGNIQNGAVTDTKLSAGVQADIASRLRRDANEILGAVISVDAVGSPAGFRAGTLTWDASGARTGGSGVAMTPLGLVAYNDATPTFTLNASTGAATFAGSLNAATGTFAGTVRVGSSPTISGTTMTGSGAVINADGTFALGTAAGNITYNGSTLTFNGPVVAAGNISGQIPSSKIDHDAFTVSMSGGGQTYSQVGAPFTRVFLPRTATPSGGTAPYTYAWTFSITENSSGLSSAIMTGDAATNTVGFTAYVNSTGAVTGRATCIVTDATGRVATAFTTIRALEAI
jgi:hypothetical protein